jgi:hypothetical protein
VVTDLLIDHHLAHHNYDEIFRVCKENSRAEAKPNPELWNKVLVHLVDHCEMAAGKCEDDEALEEAQDLLGEFLDEIEKDKILPAFQVATEPLPNSARFPPPTHTYNRARFVMLGCTNLIVVAIQVMKVLSTNPTLPLTVAKKYLAKFMRDSLNDIDDDRRQIYSLNTSTSQMTARPVSAVVMAGSDVSPCRHCRIGEVGLRSAVTDAARSTSSAHGTVFSEANKYEEIKRSMHKGAGHADNEVQARGWGRRAPAMLTRALG